MQKNGTDFSDEGKRVSVDPDDFRRIPDILGVSRRSLCRFTVLGIRSVGMLPPRYGNFEEGLDMTDTTSKKRSNSTWRSMCSSQTIEER
jgi:hypothetical protein